jgi:hypothetical protein
VTPGPDVIMHVGSSSLYLPLRRALIPSSWVSEWLDRDAAARATNGCGVVIVIRVSGVDTGR